MKNVLLLIALSAASQFAHACDATSSLPLAGVVSVDTCRARDPGCVSASRAVYEYIEAQPDDPTSFSIAGHASPWRFYSGDMRIMTVEDIAQVVRTKRDPKVNRVELDGSWTGVSPSPGTPSLASRLSKALNGFPVTGKDGFLWLDKHGAMRTTHQAFTIREGNGPYGVKAGQDVMVSLAIGWAAGHEDQFGSDPEMMLMAGVANDVFLLCPDGALADFETAANMGNAIAAYNAAIIRLDRNHDGDRDAALKLLKAAAAKGDAPAAARLKTLQP